MFDVSFGCGADYGAEEQVGDGKYLAEAHFRVEPELKHVFLLHSSNEDDPNEPIKLLEVIDQTLMDEIMPVSFRADPARGVAYPSAIIEMSTSAFQARKTKTIQFRGRRWKIGQDLLATAPKK